MQYIDQRLSKILSDIRIEEARSRRRPRDDEAPEAAPIKQRLGHWLIRHDERPAESEPEAA